MSLLAKTPRHLDQAWAQRVVDERAQGVTVTAGSVTDVDVASIAVSSYGFLQTSPEYFLKRLLAAGIGDCYQLAPVFRHDERGRHHNPEFTLLEWYRLGFDHHALMAEVRALIDWVLGPGEWQTCTYAELVGPKLAGDAGADRATLDLAFAEACAALAGRASPPLHLAEVKLTRAGC